MLQLHTDAEKRDKLFEEKAAKLAAFGTKIVATGKMVAVGTNSGNKKVAEALIAQSAQVIIVNYGNLGNNFKYL